MSQHAAPTHGHLWDRLAEAKSRLAPVQSQYRVLFENPAEPDAPAAVLVPDPNWMAAALAGNVLPPIDTYLRDQRRTRRTAKRASVCCPYPCYDRGRGYRVSHYERHPAASVA